MDATERFFAEGRVSDVSTGDARLRLRQFGRGPALVLLHGWPLDGYTWRHLLPRLAESWTCHVFDLAGLGDSEWSGATDFSFDAHARRLGLALASLGIERCAVVAHDTGATVARRLAVSGDVTVDRLCLINTEMPGHRPPFIPLYQHLLAVPGAQLAFRTLLRLRVFRESRLAFGGCFLDRKLLRGEFHAHNVAPLIASARRTEGVVRYLRGIDWAVVDALGATHARLRMPVMLVWGEDDPTFPIETARGMTAQFAGPAPCVAISGACLLPHEERPTDVLRAMLPFLAGTAEAQIV